MRFDWFDDGTAFGHLVILLLFGVMILTGFLTWGFENLGTPDP